MNTAGSLQKSGTVALARVFQATDIDAKSVEEIRASWEPGLSEYKEMRRNYLLYP